MADELARLYFEKLKVAEQQIFDLQLELAGENKSAHAATTVATSREALQQRIAALEHGNARVEEDGGEYEHDEDEADDDDEAAHIVMCDCGVDLLAQIQDNKALQDSLASEKAKCAAVQSQVKNLRKQIAERDENIAHLTAQKAVQVKEEPDEGRLDAGTKRKRTTDTDSALSIRANHTGSLAVKASALPDHMQHPSRAATTGHTLQVRPDAGYTQPSPAQMPNPALFGNYYNAARGSIVSPFLTGFSNAFVPQSPFLARMENAPSAANVTPHSQAASSIETNSRGQVPVTHPDRARQSQASASPKKVIESGTSPQDSSTKSGPSDFGSPTEISVDGFPLTWKLQRIQGYLTKHGLSPMSLRRPKATSAYMTFSGRRDATNALAKLGGKSIEGTILKVSFARR